MRGCIPTPRHKLAKARWAGHYLRDITPPANFATICRDYDMAGNDQFGDCVSAEESNAKRAYSVAIGQSEIEISGDTVVAWASHHGYLNGADLHSVLDTMQNDGMADTAGTVHCDGTPATVDWTNKQEVMAAIYTEKTVKIAVAADQLEAVVGNTNGWFLTKASRDPNTDHCVGLHGYGTAQFLATICGVAVPEGLAPNTFCVLLYTWGTVGIVTWEALQAIMAEGEAWIRTPGDVVNTPNPTPGPEPTPTPTPGPKPCPWRREQVAMAMEIVRLATHSIVSGIRSAMRA
jgi:hypothetical protein